MKRTDIIDEIIEVLESDETLLIEAVEQLDDWNGFLGDYRYFGMLWLPDMLYGKDIIDIMNMAYFGRDEGSLNEYASFNPNRNYFRFNAYGNLVSADYKDYSSYLTEYFIEDLYENRYKLSVIDENPELKELFNKLDMMEEMNGD